jgi:hypothetical protein
MGRALRAVWSLGFAIALTSIFAGSSPLFAETIVNNVFSPFSTIQIVGSRPGPRPPYPWSPECNQGFNEWRPVCAVTRNRITITYSNKCMAELDGAITLYDEECPRRVSCSYAYEPVCARINRPVPLPLEEALKSPPLRPFINECFTRTLPDRVRGETPPAEAQQELAREITILRKYGDELHGPGPRYRYYGRSGIEDFANICPRSCPEGGLVVCALDHNNVFRLYKNKCSAVMAGSNPNILRYGDLSKCR